MEQSDQPFNFLEHFIQGAHKLGLSFSEEILWKFGLYYDELRRWDRSINLTGLRTDSERTILLFVDSLAGHLVLGNNPDVKIVDIGTGGGFPGIPLKLALPALDVVLMEPRSNKIAFLHNIIGKLNLPKISVLPRRLEDFDSRAVHEEKCNVAICKGVNVDHVLPHLDRILKKDGKLVVFRSKNIDNHSRLKGMLVFEEFSYDLPFGYGSRVLSVLKYKS
ncbi:16S rRNA (guanine(527)-N(7))-methyltransferase RsmG [Candidatus Nitrospira neomarina]|uniref:Ribosomal RNA small subunit methyltransferase G n=1 Tax=Candidatus Nitrospira neomarina TaxID=3020899 RepID=A0AA96JV71_9BACT|nr:16S rRNA (guanine(527)-N(7))-methyltransferase RsmG [Candidatus Nitrospira neomarina]WNM61153.1 16S rRNA (guanine(527)-N(7))-methyltransferase RsmG [Candidatus Nitrospira neomarina]